MPAHRVFHWKHGWIPLDHTAAAEARTARPTPSLSAVSLTDLPRSRRILAAHSRGRFALHDKQTGHTLSIPESLANQLHSDGHTITAVNNGTITTGRENDEEYTFDSSGRERVVWRPIHDPDGYVKQSFDTGNKGVYIENDMTPAQTKDLLNAVGAAIEACGPDTSLTIYSVRDDDSTWTFHPNAAGYVMPGIPIVNLNPKLARGDWQSTSLDSFMPAARQFGFMQYAVAHEMGHIFDAKNGHSLSPDGDQPNQADALRLWEEYRSYFGGYGRKDAHEAYAEAYAQWHLSGPGTSVVADAYAKVFGWKR